jgi:hypothetical protein
VEDSSGTFSSLAECQASCAEKENPVWAWLKKYGAGLAIALGFAILAIVILTNLGKGSKEQPSEKEKPAAVGNELLTRKQKTT